MHTEINTLEALKYKIVVNKDGSKEWYINNQLHRENGHAAEWANGAKEWFINGKRHLENGPAFESANGDKEWYINNHEMTEEEFNARK